MSYTATTTALRGAALEARDQIVRVVKSQPGVRITDLYDGLVAASGSGDQWREPAVRTAIWDLISEERLIVRQGNALYTPEA